MSQPTPPGRNRRSVAIGLGLVIAWCLYLIFFGPAGPRRDLQPPRLQLQPGLKADYDWKGLVDLDGKPASFEAFRGKAIFLNLWATWCAPCLDELPSIEAAASKDRLKDVVFVCVSTDENPETLRRYVRDKHWSMIVLRATLPPPDVFLSDGLPATYLISPSGQVIAREDGPAQWDDPAAIDALEALAKPTIVR